MTKSEAAIGFFNNNYNCAQSVISVFCEKYGLSPEIALKIMSPFGAGMRSGEICGALSGALAVIGLKYGMYDGDMQAKIVSNTKTREFVDEFRILFGSIICRELLGCDLSTPEGMERRNNKPGQRIQCTGFVSDAVRLLEKYGC